VKSQSSLRRKVIDDMNSMLEEVAKKRKQRNTQRQREMFATTQQGRPYHSGLRNSRSQHGHRDGVFTANNVSGIHLDDKDMYYQQKIRFMQKDHEHRNFIKAFLFDHIFKTFL